MNRMNLVATQLVPHTVAVVLLTFPSLLYARSNIYLVLKYLSKVRYKSINSTVCSLLCPLSP